MGSIGGDLSAASVNPAGLGLYKTNEVVISPGFRFFNDKSNYLGNNTNGSAGKFNLGTSGFVSSYPGAYGANNAFAITINQTANFNNHIHYKGQNAYSSFAEQYAEEFAASGLSIDNGILGPTLSYGTRMALYTYLIDTAAINGNLQVIAQPNNAALINQDNDLRTSGGITEIGFSLATNKHDKWLLGATVGIPILSYTRDQTYSESDATGNTNNDFESFVYQEHFTSKGVGLNAKLGALFKPNSSLRLGLAIHTPTLFGLTDKIRANMITRTENYTSLSQISISSDSLDQLAGSTSNSVNYNLYTPWKFIVSGSWVFGGDEFNIRKQKGFLTADIEYTTTNSARLHTADQSSDNAYLDSVNATVRQNYKGSLGLRLGGELKFNTLLARAGLAYYTSPYQDGSLKADRLFLSAGLGYRNKGMFIDLTYVEELAKDVNFPYRLRDKNNIPALLKESGGTIVLTFGIKLF